MTDGAPVIATIGYQGARLEDFMATLKGAGIALLIDVRAMPFSRRPEYAKNKLAAALRAAGIDYLHLGALGSPPAARAAAAAGDTGAFESLFVEHLSAPPGLAALDRAAALANERAVCLMCLERAPEQCHRRFVAAALAKRTGLQTCDLAVTAAPGPLFATDRDQ